MIIKVEIDRDIHRNVKSYAALNEIKIRQAYRELIEKALKIIEGGKVEQC